LTDLKPENVMLVPDPVNPGLDWVKVVDFGIAKVRAANTPTMAPDGDGVKTRVGSFMGTPLYMAPEQHGQAENVDGKADVFSLGVMLYEMLGAKLPFEGNALSLFDLAPISVDKVNGAVPSRLAAQVQRMMAPKPAQRPTMEQVAKELAAFLPLRVVKPGRRWLVIPAAVAALLAGALLFFVLRPRHLTTAEVKGRARAVLSTFLRNMNPSVRLMTVRALGQSRDLEQRSLLEPLLKDPQQPPGVIEEAARALGKVGAMEAQPTLLGLLSRHEDLGVQVAAAGALAQLQHPRGTEALRRLILDQDGASLGGAHQVQAALLLLERGDASGAPLLWAGIERGTITQTLRVQALGRLALSGDTRAQQLLAAELSQRERPLTGEARINLALSLARLGQESGWSLLRKVAHEAGPDRLLALRLLVSLGESAGQGELLKLATARRQPEAVRELAVAGLADSGRADVLLPLGAVLYERDVSERLQIAAAGAILKLAAEEPGQLAEQSLSWARAALDSDSVIAREMAVAALGDMSAAQTMGKSIGLLGRALQDREAPIRKSAARALGRKSARAALQVLLASLDDSAPEVRAISMQAILEVVTALKGRGDRDAEKLVVMRLLRQASSDSELDRVVASGVLLKLGEPSQRETLRSGLVAADPRVRRVAIELAEPDGDTFGKALHDSDDGVRFAAARWLAGQSAPPERALAILREAATRGDSDGLSAYGLLQKLGETAAPPPGLHTLLTNADLPTRFAMLEMLPQLALPVAEVLRLLRLGLLDPAAVIRLRVARVAGVFYLRTGQASFLEIVRRLLNDPEVIVRAQVADLAAELASAHPAIPPKNPEGGAVRSKEAPLPANQASQQESPKEISPVVPPVATAGKILLEGEEGVRVRIDKGASQPLTSKPVSVAIGKHRISYLGGAEEVRVAPGQSITVRIPVALSEQLLQDSRDALGQRQLERAQEHLSRAHRLLQRGKISRSLQAEHAYLQGRLHEARGQLREALNEYNRCLNVPAHERHSALNTALQATLHRLSSQAGRIQIFTTIGGTCQMSQELLLSPGEQVIGVGKGQLRTVFSQAGSTNKVMACQ
jgi:HEAT repeat protein